MKLLYLFSKFDAQHMRDRESPQTPVAVPGPIAIHGRAHLFLNLIWTSPPERLRTSSFTGTSSSTARVRPCTHEPCVVVYHYQLPHRS